jgi:hypothetical protein
MIVSSTASPRDHSRLRRTELGLTVEAEKLPFTSAVTAPLLGLGISIACGGGVLTPVGVVAPDAGCDVGEMR